ASGIRITFGFTLRVSAIAITDPQVLPQTAVGGVPFSYTFTASGGGAITWTAAGLPAGFTMSSSGTLTGTLALNALGGATVFSVTVADGAATLSRRFSLLTRAPNPAVLNILTQSSLADVAVRQRVITTLRPSGGQPPSG